MLLPCEYFYVARLSHRGVSDRRSVCLFLVESKMQNMILTQNLQNMVLTIHWLAQNMKNMMLTIHWLAYRPFLPINYY
jgi:hypothetical protein